MAETDSDTPAPPTPDPTPAAETPPEPAPETPPEPAPEVAAEPAPTAAPEPAPEPGPAAAPAEAPTSVPKEYTWGVGRRKSSVARVRIRPGSGQYKINKRDVDVYFPLERHRLDVRAPLEAAQATGKWDVFVNVKGGGITGQAGAVLLGLARALVKASPDVEGALRDGGLLTRDSRMVERKKYGRRGARRSFQFSKR